MTNLTVADRINRLERLLAKTEVADGGVHIERPTNYLPRYCDLRRMDGNTEVADYIHVYDAAFLIEAAKHLPVLIDELRRLDEETARLHALNSELIDAQLAESEGTR